MRSDAPAAEDPDLSLLRAVASGDALACTQLVDRHLRQAHALAWRLLDDASEAEDVCQDAFLKLWQVAGRWEARAQVSTWLYQVVLNGARDRLRRRRERAALDPDALLSAEASPERAVDREQASARLRTALRCLPKRQREAILLCHYQGLAQTAAAQLLGVSVDALESLLARGRRALRERLIEETGVAGQPT